MVYNEMYNIICKEHFNLLNLKTLDTIVSINENDQNIVLNDLAEKLYETIISKIDDIDFGSIPNSKGDIEKIENFDRIVDCLDLLTRIITEYKQDITPVKAVVDCINNLRERKQMFEKAYLVNAELPIVIYNTMALNIVTTTSFLISTCVEYIKDTTTDTYVIVVDKVGLKHTIDFLILKNIIKFNNICKNGELDRVLNETLSVKAKHLMGVEIAVGATSVIAIATIIITIIPILRECIYFFYFARVKISDYFTIQADLLEMNASSLEYKDIYRNGNVIDKDRKNDIITKQKSIISPLRKIADFFRIKNKQATNKTEIEIKNDSKKYNIDDVIGDKHLDSTADSLF